MLVVCGWLMSYIVSELGYVSVSVFMVMVMCMVGMLLSCFFVEV